MTSKNILDPNNILFKTAYSEPIEEQEIPEDAFVSSYSDDEEYEEDEFDETYEYIDDDAYHVFQDARNYFEDIRPKITNVYDELTPAMQCNLRIALRSLLGKLNEITSYTQNYYT